MDSHQLGQFRDAYQNLRERVEQEVIGQSDAVSATITALFAGGHVLLDGAPGVGKTMLVRSLADALNVQFRRIQCTPDIMPADIIGTYIVLEAQGRRRFEFQQGPIFTNLLLADQINRATPKAQSAMLEALEEFSVTVANETYDLPEPFFAVATRSDDESEGVFPLPETQLDRFHFHIRMEQPTGAALESILQRSTGGGGEVGGAVLDREQLVELRALVPRVELPAAACSFAAKLVQHSQPEHSSSPLVKQYVRRGASPRGGQAMVLAAKVGAMLEGRDSVAQGDLVKAAPLVLSHRLALNYDGHAQNVDPQQITSEIVKAAG